MYVYDQLIQADVEVRSADYASPSTGRFWWNSTAGKLMLYDGTNIRAMLRNDQNLVIGNNVTAANNTRINRSGSGVLQFVPGSDVTAEGSAASSLNQLGFRCENYTDAGKPAAGNAGRLIYVTDKTTFKGDSGSSWIALGGGGGGGALQWIEGDNSPSPFVDSYGNQVYAYAQNLTQKLFTAIKVPNGYITGSQINFRTFFYSPDSSGNVNITTIATLIRAGTDQISSTTNQMQSNVATTLSSANVLIGLTSPLTDSTGKINGVSVSPGDLILLSLVRASSDTSTSDANVLAYASEVTFS